MPGRGRSLKGAVSRRPPSPVSLLLPILSVLAAATAFAASSRLLGGPVRVALPRRPRAFRSSSSRRRRGARSASTRRAPCASRRTSSGRGARTSGSSTRTSRSRPTRRAVDFPTKTATLEGHVVIDQGPTRLAGERAVFHLDTKTGTSSRRRPPSCRRATTSWPTRSTRSARRRTGSTTASSPPATSRSPTGPSR